MLIPSVKIYFRLQNLLCIFASIITLLIPSNTTYVLKNR